MTLATLGYALVGLLTGSMLVLSSCLSALTHRFNGTLETLDRAYFEQVLPLRQIVANADDIRYYLLAAASDVNSSTRHMQAIQISIRKNQLLWAQLETAPQMDLVLPHRSYEAWLQALVLPLPEAKEAGTMDKTASAALTPATYKKFEQTMAEQIATMRQRGQSRHQGLVTWQRHVLYLALALTLATTGVAAWLAWRTISRHGKKLEAINRSLAETNRDLDWRVEQRTAALQHTNADMRRLLMRLHATQDQRVQNEKLAALGFLVSGVAHELNTPIGNGLLATTTLAELLKQLQLAMTGRMQRTFLAEQVDMMANCCDLLEQSLHRSSSLITRFKEIAVDQHGEPRVQFELDKLLSEVRAARNRDLQNAECAMTIQFPARLRLTSYPQSLARVFHNLIDNALLHAFDGRSGSRIDIVASESLRHCVHITFRDNGRGMPAPVLQRVFDPFFTTKMGHGSGGLGMTIVHNTVTGILGGTISVGIGEPSGTSIAIILPRIGPAQSIPQRSRVAATGP